MVSPRAFLIISAWTVMLFKTCSLIDFMFSYEEPKTLFWFLSMLGLVSFFWCPYCASASMVVAVSFTWQSFQLAATTSALQSILNRLDACLRWLAVFRRHILDAFARLLGPPACNDAYSEKLFQICIIELWFSDITFLAHSYVPLKSLHIVWF